MPESRPLVSQAQRMDRIQPFHVMDLLARARRREAAGHSVVHMEIGEPDFPAADPIIRAAHAALAAGHTRYTPAVGLPELREAIAGFYHRRFGVTVAPERIIVTPGASGALQLALAALVDPGDEVLMTDPGYPCNRHLVYLLDGRPLGLPVDASTGYQLSVAQVEAAWTARTRAVMVATPSNPTGTLLAPSDLSSLARAVRRLGGILIVDEIYQGLVYGTQSHTILRDEQEVFVINSFSKYFGMTGWRIGWLVAPERFVDPLDRLAQNLFLAAPTLSQHAALAAFGEEALMIFEQRRAEFERRRDYLLASLRALGFEIPLTPGGAFYLYANVSEFTDDSHRFVSDLLSEQDVAVTPGIDFGEHGGLNHVRFAYTTSLQMLEQGVERIRRFLGGGL